MRYWLSIHWPPLEGDDPESATTYIWLQLQHLYIADQRIRAGDRVALYQSRTGPREIWDGRSYRRVEGRQGVILIGKILRRFRNPGPRPVEYVGREPRTWYRCAQVELVSRNGFVPRQELLAILSLGRQRPYSPGYNLRGIGDDHSGLKEITEEHFAEIQRYFG